MGREIGGVPRSTSAVLAALAVPMLLATPFASDRYNRRDDILNLGSGEFDDVEEPDRFWKRRGW